jgi:hypothetical protein
MYDHTAFGGHLRSSLAFPELRPHTGVAPDWTLTVGDPEPRPADARLLGRQRYANDVEVRLLQCADGLRVETSDIGDFDVRQGGRSLVWRAVPGAREDLARFDVLGRVLPLALHLQGALALHGSSVVFPGGDGVAFLAPKGHGKSTLALALAQRGARLLSDDVTVAEPAPDGRHRLRPGVHAVRLWDDSARRLDAWRYGEPGAIGQKLVVQALPELLCADAPAPLRAIYLLHAAGEHDVVAAHRQPVAAVAATLQLVRQSMTGVLLGGPEATRVLERAAAVARATPVFDLAIARGYERLDEVAAAVAAWHGGLGAGDPSLAQAVAGAAPSARAGAGA